MGRLDAAAVILAGGRSSRMGSPKASLDWHGSTLLRRASGIASRTVAGPVVVVAAPGQILPRLDRRAEVAFDAREGRGPLQGLAAGFAALRDRADAAFVCSTDAPFLHPAFIRRVLGALAPEVDAVLPHVRGFPHPLSSACRVAVLPQVEALIAADRLRLLSLFDDCRTVRLDERALLRDRSLAAADPELRSVQSLDEPAEYDRALALPAPEVSFERRVRDATGPCQRSSARAWTLGELCGVIAQPLGDRVAVAIDGESCGADPELPLVDGDDVSLVDD